MESLYGFSEDKIRQAIDRDRLVRKRTLELLRKNPIHSAEASAIYLAAEAAVCAATVIPPDYEYVDGDDPQFEGMLSHSLSVGQSRMIN